MRLFQCGIPLPHSMRVFLNLPSQRGPCVRRRRKLALAPTQNMVLQDCEKFLAQTASYVAANGKRVGVLCVLDCSVKKRPAFPAEDGVGVLVHQISETPIFAITILIQGNLASPSMFSR